MERNRKMNRCAIAAFTIMYIVGVICLFMFHPIVASAAEQVPGGPNNSVSIRSERIITSTKLKFIESYDFRMSGDFEAVGYLQQTDEQYILTVVYCKDGRSYNVNQVTFDDALGMYTMYDSDGNIRDDMSKIYTKDNFPSISTVPYQAKSEGLYITCLVKGMKVFRDLDALRAYIDSGSLDGMINEDNVDSGQYDSDIGYLHDLKHDYPMYGEQDENGFYENFDDRFTWSDYYPEYDDSYLVEVRASCEIEVRKWFGIGKSTVYNSDIRQLATGVKYKDLEYIVSLTDQKALFSDFINEHMPGNDSVSDVISAASYRFDTYYFRIYRWDEESESYKYGLWVRLTKDGSALDATLNTTVDAGELDKNGNWKQKADSDYGKGKKDTSVAGSGETLEDAKADADKNREERENGGKPLDLSNTNFQELWEWFTGSLYSFFNGLGVIPEFFGRLFSFLPSPVIGFIGLGILVAIILRVLGR